MNSRREFMVQLSLGGVALLSGHAMAQAAMLGEKDPQALAVGYVDDESKVDKAKFPGYVPGQQCGGCSLYQGKSSDASGGCLLFGDKLVAAKGWCNAWTNMA